MPTSEYEDRIEQIYKNYDQRVLKLLEEIGTKCKLVGMTVDNPWDASCDEYVWRMRVWRSPERGSDEDCIEVSIEIAEEAMYDNPDGTGINFGMDIVAYGGEIIGGAHPMNYTRDVWVPTDSPFSDEEIEARWMLMQTINTDAVPYMIINHEVKQ